MFAREHNVDYRDVLPTYQERATRAMQDRYIPLGMKELVKEYFSSLQPNGASTVTSFTRSRPTICSSPRTRSRSRSTSRSTVKRSRPASRDRAGGA